MAHATIAVSESTFQRSIDLIVKNFSFEKEDSGDFGLFSAGYDIAAHLEGGDVDFRSDNTIEIKELDLKWDRLAVTLGLDIPGICVGGWCIPMPWPATRLGSDSARAASSESPAGSSRTARS